MRPDHIVILPGFLENTDSQNAMTMVRLAQQLGVSSPEIITGDKPVAIPFGDQTLTGNAWFAVRDADLMPPPGQAPDLRGYRDEIIAAADSVIERIPDTGQTMVIGFSQGAMIAEAIYYRSGGNIPVVSIQGANIDFTASPDFTPSAPLFVLQRDDMPNTYHDGQAQQIITRTASGPHLIQEDDVVLLAGRIESFSAAQDLSRWREAKLSNPKHAFVP